MKIGELARRTGLSTSRIRFYESIGLLGAVGRRANGYRTYTPEAVVTLDLIAAAQQAGFSLDEIRTLLPGEQGRWDHDALLATVRRKIAEIEAFAARLAASRAGLLAVIGQIEAKPDDIDCTRNARRVLSSILGGLGEPGGA